MRYIQNIYFSTAYPEVKVLKIKLTVAPLIPKLLLSRSTSHFIYFFFSFLFLFPF